MLSGLIIVTTRPIIVQAAQNKLATPEFSVKLVSHPYDVPTTTTVWVDPYTGEKTTTTNQGYHVENRSIEITRTKRLRRKLINRYQQSSSALPPQS